MKTTAAIVLLLAQAASIHAAGPTTTPASNTDEPNAKPGKRPYEMDWANRTQPNHPQLVDFEDLTGWRVRCLDGAKVKLFRSREELVFGQYSAKALYSGESARSRFVIEPPAPIDIPGKFTAVNLWVRGNNWGWIDPPATARTDLHLLVRDAKDEDYRISIGVVSFDYWFLMHATIVSPTGDKRIYEPSDSKSDPVIDYPVRFIGIEVSGCADDRPAKLFFDALSFYEIQYKPLTFEPVPDKLPWPTTPDTILPTLNRPVKSSLLANPKPSDDAGKATGPRYDLIADGANGRIRYRYEPKTGLLDDLVVDAFGLSFRPCRLGGIEFDLAGKHVKPGSKDAATKLLRHDADDQRVLSEWEISRDGQSARYTYELRIKGKSLIVDVAARGGKATRLDIGLAEGLPSPKAIYMPFLTYGLDWPRIVCSPGKDSPLFLLSLIDYYNSDASILFGAPRVVEQGCLAYAGGSAYMPKTDGKRNDLRERIFINVSSDVHEVLPGIPNPKCDTGDIARQYTWRNIGHPQQEMLAQYKAYGIDKFIACHHEVGWRDAGESFTMRLRAAPRIGDEGLAEYGKWVRQQGYRFGTYTNYVDFAPVNSNWNEDDVCLNPDGSWQTAWFRCYALKPLRAAEKEAWYAPRIHEKFGTTAQYCDVHTAYTPWGRTDYDARTPGAGMFRTQFNAFARLLWNESKAHHGPVFSEGCHQWFYAGIVDGNYGQIVPYNQGSLIEPIVDFWLLKAHPLCTDFGMGAPDMYYPVKGAWRDDRSRLSPYFDQFHVSTIAFGHIGYLANEWGLDGTLKSYHLLQALQQRYSMVPVAAIRYFDGKRLLDTSAALISEVYKRRQIHIRYENGLDVWCNLNPEQSWDLLVDDKSYRLPPRSFLAQKPGDILAYSAQVGGVRHELVSAKDYLYLDSRGDVVRSPVISARGAVAVKPDGQGAWWIIPATQCEEVTVSTEWLARPKGARFAATAHDVTGKEIAKAGLRVGSDEITVMPIKGAIKYRVSAPTFDAPRNRWTFQTPTRKQIIGDSLPVTVTVKTASDVKPSTLSVTASFVTPDGSEAPQGAVKLSDARSARMALKLPDAVRPHTRCWYRFRLQQPDRTVVDERWFDVTAVPVFDLAIHPTDRPHSLGRPTSLRTTVRSYLAAPAQAQVSLTAPETWRAAPPTRTVELPPDSPLDLSWTLHPPDAPSVEPVSLKVIHDHRSAVVTRYLRTRPTDWIVANLLSLPMETGHRIRGGQEQPCDPEATGGYAHAGPETVGGQAKTAIFMHPPFKTGVGYTFAKIPVALPTGTPCLEFSLGFREGSTTTDGCLFKVVVIDKDEEREVFAKQYARLSQWSPQRVDLSAYAGKRICLKLIADVGPADDSNSDWACWGEPRITMGQDAMAVEIHETRPAPAFLPPPKPLKGLKAADLSRIVSAEVTLETAGVQIGQYASYLYLNGVKIGMTPPSTSDTVWQAGAVPVPKDALKTIGHTNRLVIKNPGRDSMKVRNLCLRFKLEDGCEGTSCVDVGPYTSAKGWLHAEGDSVEIGLDLPTMRLLVPVE
ncbi:MAG: hypothetical protein JXQ73_06815 [Phycisphaerae bacterium]|nr:hypothetical protein [Phycisphaerae bacterium]